MNEHLTADEVERLAETAGGARLAAPRGAHLERCDECRREIAALRSLHRRLASLGHVAVPPGFAAAVLRRVRLPVPWYDRVWALARAHWGALVTATAALALLTGAGGWWLFGAQGVAPVTLVSLAVDGLRELAVEGLLAVGRIAFQLGVVDAGSSIADRVGPAEALGGFALASAIGLLSLWTMLRLLRLAPRLARTSEAR